MVRAITAFAQGDHARDGRSAAALRYEIWRIGGSHAQRDLFTQTLIAAALGAQRWPLARALLAERVALKPASASSWRQYGEVLASWGTGLRPRRRGERQRGFRPDGERVSREGGQALTSARLSRVIALVQALFPE